jgi:inner membrane protein
MDTLTHSLAGLAVASLRRSVPDTDPQTDRAVWWGAVLAANLPDLDVLYRPDGLLDNIRYHRGLTHSIPGTVALSLLLTLVLRLFFRRMRTGVVFTWSLGSMLFAHLFFDWITGYGTRLLLPLSNERFAAHWAQIIDPYLTLPLLAGALLWLRGWPRVNPLLPLRTALVICLLYLGMRGVTQQVLVARLHQLHPPASSRVTVTPTILSPFRWEWVVELNDRFYLGDVEAPWLGLTRRPFRTYGWVVREEEHAVVAAARKHPDVADFLAFARHPHVTHEPLGEHYYKVKVTDFRGGYMFYFFALVDTDLNVRGAFAHMHDLLRYTSR